ncbi:hypothetical protein EU803_06910 [Loktanella sp. IMCC34160]|uniref:hypothetical protein n=1 Tax=Loktanella sp. IMCC34160 TaxID=2510646 RepID=UPI00101D58F8|nr:hypothetical protein [Loktanella sp. IMCC34160]RYG92166.1 hypothetical protein EU803_06910 [Loktanella sp. IMCC34160]
MKIKNLAGLAATTALVSAGAVWADSGSNSFSGYYGNFDRIFDDYGSAQVLSFGLEREYDFGNAIVFGGLAHTEFSGDIKARGFSSLNLGAAYRITPEIAAGAEIWTYADDWGNYSDLGLFAQYDAGSTRAALYVQTSLDNDGPFYGGIYSEFMPTPDLDLRVSAEFSEGRGVEWIQLAGDYQIGQFSLTGAFRTDPEYTDFNITSLGLGYQVNDQLDVDFRYTCFDDGPFYRESMSVGGSYELGTGVSLAAYFGREQGGFGPTLNTLGLEFEFETGKRGVVHHDLMQQSYDDIFRGFPIFIF